MKQYTWNKNKVSFNHHPNIPESFRMLIMGPSNWKNCTITENATYT